MQKGIKKISVFGCGWLGFPLAKELVEKGYEVNGSTTSEDKLENLKEAGIKPFLIRLLPEPEGDSLKEFLDTDLVIICFPPHFKKYGMLMRHANQIKTIKDAVESLPVDKVIYTSSISVYPRENKVVTENSDTDPEDHAKAIVLAEEQLRIGTQLDATILRLGGLMGYDRIPIKYFLGKKDVTTGELPVNYVHRDDAIQVIHQIIAQNDEGAWNKVFNVVSPNHQHRKKVLLKNAKDFGLEAPTFKESKHTPPYKIVDSQKLIDKLGFEFKYPNPLDYYYEL